VEFTLTLHFRFSREYPAKAPHVATSHPQWRNDAAERELRSAMSAAATEALGEPMVFAMVQAAQDWLEAKAASGGGALLEASAAPSNEEHDTETEDAEEVSAERWWDLEEIDRALLESATLEAAESAAREAETTTTSTSTTSGTGIWREAGAAAHRRSWRLTLGLVGKPSAGKSTFFNAIVAPPPDSLARVGSFPFTTIEPNISVGHCLLECPCSALGVRDRCTPEHGRAGAVWPDRCMRRVPLLLKDVAGLVPGAWTGRGRGSAFLHDLTDADALLHVVDASGSTDREGNAHAGGAADGAADEVRWVREELHMWIFANVRKKFGRVHKLAVHSSGGGAGSANAALDRLLELFTGYNASKGAVIIALRRAGLIDHPPLHAWGERELHLLVANFLRVRFPVVLALNKSDSAGAETGVSAVRARFPGEPMVAVSAKAESWLRSRESEGLLRSQECVEGAMEAPEAKEGAPPEVEHALGNIRERVFSRWGGTGCSQLISLATQQRRPLLLFPVVELDSLASLVSVETAAARARGDHAPAPALETAVVLRPNCTVADAFEAVKHAGLMDAKCEFVRAEAIVAPAVASKIVRQSPVNLRKDDVLPSAPWIVIKLSATKKVSWQQK